MLNCNAARVGIINFCLVLLFAKFCLYVGGLCLACFGCLEVVYIMMLGNAVMCLNHEENVLSLV